MNLLLPIFFAISLFSVVSSKTWSNTTVERPVLIGAFNIQNLGQSKMGNKTVMDIVKKILLRYDLVLIQEIVTTDERLMDNLVTDLNKLHSEKDSKYMMAISERLGRGNAKEQYAFLYRNDKFNFLGARTYPDTEDDFMRPPYIGHFATPTLRDIDSLLVIGVHTQPKNAANETSAMADVYDYAAKTFKVKDAIMMGDMNAGCANVRISDWDGISLWNRPEFTWLITHDFDTTLSVNCCPYDRIVIAGGGIEDAVIWDSVAAFKYRDLYGVSTDMALAVSDHWPVEVKLRGGSKHRNLLVVGYRSAIHYFNSLWASLINILSTSKSAKSNLKPSLCMVIEDSRPTALPSQIQNQKSTYGFAISRTESGIDLSTSASDGLELLKSFRTLQGRYPDWISKEILDAVAYKLEHGALDDKSSHDDLEHQTNEIRIQYDYSDESITVVYCVLTTVN